MDGSTGSERVFVARVSAVLFVLGLLVPFFMVFVGGALKIHKRRGRCRFWLFSVSEVLAVILGGVGWRHASGKTGSVGGVAAICLALAFGTLRATAGLRRSSPLAPVKRGCDIFSRVRYKRVPRSAVACALLR